MLDLVIDNISVGTTDAVQRGVTGIAAYCFSGDLDCSAVFKEVAGLQYL